MDGSMMQSPGGDSATKGKRRKKKRSKKQVVEENEAETRDQLNDKSETPDGIGDYRVASHESRMDLLENDLIVMPLGKHPNVCADSTENIARGNATRRKKRAKRNKKAKIKDAAQSMDHAKLDQTAEGKVSGDIEGKGRVGQTAEIKVDVQSMDQTKMDTVSTKDLFEGNVAGKGKKKRKSLCEMEITNDVQSMGNHEMVTELKENLTEGTVNVAAKINDEAESINQIKMDKGSTENLTERIANGKRSGKNDSIKLATIEEVQSVNKHKMVMELTENLAEGDLTVKRKKKKKRNVEIKYESETINQSEMDKGSTENLTEAIAADKRKVKRKRNGGFKTGLISVNNKIKLDEGKGSSKRRSAFSTCNVKMVPVTSIRRKLLVLDVNGLLADIVRPAPKHCRGDIHISQQAIFRRPFCDDFLKFCFRNFDVGIWSSRCGEMIRKIVKYLLGDLQAKLLFCWDMSYCTQSGFKTLENYHKPLVCKELRKIWENDDPNLPWKKGDFDESNTLLVDDSPYKALLNPLHTAIFPSPYRYVDKNDTSLGPEGDIRVYLKKLAKSENVQKHVEQHPFGVKAIDEQNSSWGFYTKVLNRMSAKSGN